MDAQQIKAFIDAMASSDLAEMEFSQDGWTLRLARQGSGAMPSRPLQRPASQQVQSGTAIRQPQEAEHAAIDEVLAPLYGVVHLRPSPDEPAFITAGTVVKAGQTLCVIEAMKVFNEVRAERDATVHAVLVSSGEEVEAGQALLRFV
jgi:acetyl-CoA carboxylase biotin carboxyl carrier protein